MNRQGLRDSVSATAEVHVPRTCEQVLDYLERDMSSKLPWAGGLTMYRDRNGAGGVVLPGATVTRNPDATDVINVHTNRMTLWTVTFQCAAIGDGSNVTVGVLQINDSFWQRKTAKPKVENLVTQLANVIRDDLGG